MADGETFKTVSIYALCEPDSLEIRYVGKAIDLEARMRSHAHESKSLKFHTRKVNWLRSLGTDAPVVKVLAVVSRDNWEEEERYWIAKLRKQGCDLTNFADGGQTSPVEGKGHSEKTKAILSQKAKARGDVPPSRKGIVTSQKTKDKLSAAHKKNNHRPPLTGGWNKGTKKSHCHNGHEFNETNTGVVSRPGRTYQLCKTCAKENTKKHLLRKKQDAC